MPELIFRAAVFELLVFKNACVNLNYTIVTSFYRLLSPAFSLMVNSFVWVATGMLHKVPKMRDSLGCEALQVVVTLANIFSRINEKHRF
ncbi:hypothetical protein [Chryseolinea lacunae]|uniref:Uncharacterized protein n=1 Tax=Chryseolinea lacunae TaxID=2801331 RepID=A0ABS1KMD8_9BACT|nr:hypothetical protein [Chryseolinea lacunae]MBL0740643.1 hypothetical protein [Chryseolinea lacunae]